jgi:hypothetical protein
MIIKGKISKTHAAAIEYFASQLFSPQLKPFISISIIFKKNLSTDGFTEVSNYNSKGKPREFILEIQKEMPEKRTLMTLAHELEHVRQYCYGEIDEFGTKWLSKKLNHESIPYYRQPWEIKAFKMEKILYDGFMINYKQ